MRKLSKYQALSTLETEKVITVIRSEKEEEAYNIAILALEAGAKVIEITATTPGFLQVIRRLKEKNRTDVLIGAGTVLDEATARLAIIEGADFVVTPHFNKEIIEVCHLYQVLVVPGASDVQTIYEALKSGCHVIKLFPSNLLGPHSIPAFKGPFPQADFIPTGGVNLENMGEWFDKGALAVGIGSALNKAYREHPDRVGEYFNQVKDQLERRRNYEQTF